MSDSGNARASERYLIDTNVLSEFVKPAPDRLVLAWVNAVAPLDLCISVLTLGEVEQGISRMAASKRRTALSRWARIELPTQFVGRLLPVDGDVAVAWGTLSALAKGEGRPLAAIDGLLLATAQVHALTFVTRNVADCAGRGVSVFDPWNGATHD